MFGSLPAGPYVAGVTGCLAYLLPGHQAPVTPSDGALSWPPWNYQQHESLGVSTMELVIYAAFLTLSLVAYALRQVCHITARNALNIII